MCFSPQKPPECVPFEKGDRGLSPTPVACILRDIARQRCLVNGVNLATHALKCKICVVVIFAKMLKFVQHFLFHVALFTDH